MGNPAFGPTQSFFCVQGGTPNQYNLSQGTWASNWVMRGYAAGGTEFSNGAYPSSATGDKVVFAAQLRKKVVVLQRLLPCRLAQLPSASMPSTAQPACQLAPIWPPASGPLTGVELFHKNGAAAVKEHVPYHRAADEELQI